MKNPLNKMASDSFQISMSVFYATNFLIIGCYLPYFPVWLQSNELGAQEIGLILSAPMIIRVIFTPLVSTLADYLGNYRLILKFLCFFSFLSFFLLPFAHGFWAIFLVVLIGSLFWTSILPLTETLAMVGAKAGKIHYGSARAVGSASFIIASIGAGILIDYFKAGIVAYLLILTAGLLVISVFFLPPPQGKGRLRAEVGQGTFSVDALQALLKNKLFWLFLLGAGMGQGCHAFYYGFATVHWQTIGYSGTLVGSLWALGVIAEILLFIYLGEWLRRFNAGYLIALGAFASLFRFTVMAFDPPLYVLVFAQILHALSFGIAHLGAIYFIGKAVPEGLSATAQGIYATMSAGLFMGLMVLASGPFYAAIGAYGYLVMALMAVGALYFSVHLYFGWNGRLLVGLNKTRVMN